MSPLLVRSTVGSAGVPARSAKASCASGARLVSKEECVRQPFARHVVAGGDARAPVSPSPLYQKRTIFAHPSRYAVFDGGFFSSTQGYEMDELFT